MAADPGGGFAVTWWNEDLDGVGVLGQRFDSAGATVGDTFKVASLITTDFVLAPAVAADGMGNAVVVWSEQGVHARRFNSAGEELGAEIQVSVDPAGLDTAVAADAAGNFVVAWEDVGGIVGRRYDSAGAELGAEFQVNTYTTSGHSNPAVAADAAGNFVVAWVEHKAAAYPGYESHIRAQRYDSAGARVGAEFQVDGDATGLSHSPAVAANPPGSLLVVWTGHGKDLDIFGRCFGCPGARVAAALPDPETAVGAARRVAERLARLARRAQKRIENGVVATGGGQQRQYRKACRHLQKLVAVAARADARDTLGVPFEPVEASVVGLRALLGC